MQLKPHFSRIVMPLALSVLALLFVFLCATSVRATYADNAEMIVFTEHFVIFNDGDQSLTVKTSARTVDEALSRANLGLGPGDTVEPTLSEPIISDNFSITIYRARPVIIKDGLTEKYLMTTSNDPATIANDAGLPLEDGDTISKVKNTNFLATGLAEIYQIQRDPARLAEATPEANSKATSEATAGISTSETSVPTPTPPPSTLNVPKLTAIMGRNRYSVTKQDGTIIERQETFYDLGMSGVMNIAARECGVTAYYEVRDDGVKVDADGYILVAANLNYYPRCSVVETSLGLGRVYDTGTFAETNPEQFDIATDWTNRNGR